MKIVKMVKYQLNIFFKGTGFIMPFIVTAVFLYAMYSQKSVDVISGFLITGVFMYLLMAWVGISAAQQEDEVMEQILNLKMNSAVSYYTGKLIFLIAIAFIFTFLSILVPIIQNLLNGGDLFDRKLAAGDIIGSLLLVSSSAICGAFLGNLFHPRVIKNRKSAYTLLVLICVLSVAEIAITLEMPFLKYFLWVLPNIMYPAEIFADAQYFNMILTLKVFFMLILYATIYGALKSFICSKNKF